MSRIAEKFAELKRKGEKGFIPFIMAGDPSLEATVDLVLELERAGSDIIELGFPFSEPIADGPVIQRSGFRALKKGCTLEGLLGAVRAVRRRSEVPIVLFSYYNPLLQYGPARLARDAADAGIDGVLITDLTPEEALLGREYLEAAQQAGLDTIFLVAPTSTPERVRLITSLCSGFVYLVSRTGVTGMRESLEQGIVPMVAEIKRHSRLPVAVGFGISRPEQVAEIWRVADAAVVGSAIVAKIEELGTQPGMVEAIGRFARWLNKKQEPG